MHRDVRHTVVLLVGAGLTAALALLFALLAARWLAPEGYAEFAAAAALALAAQTALGPINGTVARFVAEYTPRGEYGRVRTLAREVGRRVALYGLLLLALSLILVPLFQHSLRFSSAGPLLVACGIVYLNLLLSVARGVLRGARAFQAFNVNTIGEAAVRLMAGVMLLLFRATATVALLAYVIALGATLLVSRVQLNRLWRGHEPSAVDGRAVRRYTAPMVVLMLTVAGFEHVDLLIVKRYFPAEDAGVYAAAVTVARAFGLLVYPVSTVLLPSLMARRQAGTRVLPALARLVGVFLGVAAVPMAIICFFSAELIEVLFGAAYAGAADVLVWLAAARIVGHVAYLLILSAAALDRFRVLVVYVPALLVQVGALMLWHTTPRQVVTILLLVQTFTMAALLVELLITARKTRPPSSASLTSS